jgi:preprotein translocase subunit SecE
MWMVSQVGHMSKLSDKWLWMGAVLVGIGAIAGNYYFAEYSLLLRVVALLIAGGLGVAIAARTTLGLKLWSEWLEVVQEIRKMHWPTRQETLQTTFAVLAMVVVMGILLWTADFALLRVIKWLTGHWGA